MNYHSGINWWAYTRGLRALERQPRLRLRFWAAVRRTLRRLLVATEW